VLKCIIVNPDKIATASEILCKMYIKNIKKKEGENIGKSNSSKTN
jgi:hypothetical protein